MISIHVNSSGFFLLLSVFPLLQSQEIDEIIKRIMAHKGVIGVIIVNNDGTPLFSQC